MNPSRAAALAALVAAVVASVCGASIYAYMLRPDLPLRLHALAGAALGATAALVAFAVVFIWARWRAMKGGPSMGAASGTCLGFVVLVLVTLLHASLRPGADGVLVSFLGQLGVASLLCGWLALLLGAALGAYIGRKSRPHGT